MNELQNVYDDVEELKTQMSTAQANIAALQNQVAAFETKTIAENTDLNNLTVGNYIIPNEAVCATLLNKPCAANSTGYVTVIEGGSDGQLIMIYRTCSKAYPSYWQRSYYGNAWGAWLYIPVMDSGWIDLPLASGITAHNATTFPCRYRKIGNKVYVEGCVVGITDVNTVVATLPEDYRPSKSFYDTTAANGGYYDTFNVRSNGELKLVDSTIPAMYATQFHFINTEFLVD